MNDRSRSRRRLLKCIAAGSGAIVGGVSLPRNWTAPVVDTVILPLHAQSTPARLPLELETLSNWWVTVPPVTLNGFASMNAVLVFQLIGAVDTTFTPGSMQIWSDPSVIGPPAMPVVFNSEPAAAVSGGNFTYDLTIDVTGLPASELQIAFRPVSDVYGTMDPTVAALQSASITLG